MPFRLHMNAGNRRTSVLLPNGILTNYAYDSDSHVTGISYNLGGNPVGNLTYAYDVLGHRVGVGGSLATMAVPQTVGSATYDAANELMSWNGISNIYGANGNLVNDTVHTYSWNARNQLVAIDSGGGSRVRVRPAWTTRQQNDFG
jgi:YD repeat-containing protein